MTLFVDGNVNYPSCRCKRDCEMSCWQLDGLTDEPCGACGCDPFVYEPAVINVPPDSPPPEGFYRPRGALSPTGSAEISDG